MAEKSGKESIEDAYDAACKLAKSRNVEVSFTVEHVEYTVRPVVEDKPLSLFGMRIERDETIPPNTIAFKQGGTVSYFKLRE